VSNHLDPNRRYNEATPTPLATVGEPNVCVPASEWQALQLELTNLRAQVERLKGEVFPDPEAWFG
jgi:PHD/YefM family antitoxin component YafN of YafNO toxin-antitoxin module